MLHHAHRAHLFHLHETFSKMFLGLYSQTFKCLYPFISTCFISSDMASTKTFFLRFLLQVYMNVPHLLKFMHLFLSTSYNYAVAFFLVCSSSLYVLQFLFFQWASLRPLFPLNRLPFCQNPTLISETTPVCSNRLAMSFVTTLFPLNRLPFCQNSTLISETTPVCSSRLVMSFVSTPTLFPFKSLTFFFFKTRP